MTTSPASSLNIAPDGRKVTEVAVGVLVQPDGRYLLSGSADQSIRLWDLTK